MFKTVTYNLRCVWNGDGIQSMTHRGGMIYDKILAERPDIVAFQEVAPHQLDFLRCIMPGYSFVGSGREKDYDGEGLYIAYREDACALVSCDIFWLSNTPRIPASRFDEQSPFPRITVEAVLRHKATNELIRIVDVHLDHVSDAARVMGMRCLFDILAKKQALHHLPTVILGDFNAAPDSEVITLCNDDKTLSLRDVTKNIPVSFHNFGRDEQKIDYIFASPDVTAKNVSAWEDSTNGVYLSDHYPIIAELSV